MTILVAGESLFRTIEARPTIALNCMQAPDVPDAPTINRPVLNAVMRSCKKRKQR